MDCFTYGNTPAAMTLSKIIVEQEKSSPNNTSRKVGRIWGDFTEGLNNIYTSNMKNEFKINLYRLWTDKYVIRCRESHLPKIVQTFLENAIVTRFKMFINKDIRSNYQ